MPQEAGPEHLQLGLSILKWLGITSFAGLIGFPLTLYSLRPRLTIVEVKDKNPKHSFESRLVIKNIGRLPAQTIWANVYNLDFDLGGMITGEGNTLAYNGRPVSKLDAGESMEVPALPQVGASPGIPLRRCSYRLEIEYCFRFFRFRKIFRRYWHIELRNFTDSFTWHFTPE